VKNVADTAVGGGPTTFTIDPTTDLLAGNVCSVTVFAAQIADNDAGDPPNNMAANFTFSFSVPPDANDDAYLPNIVGNVGVNTATSSGFSVLANDVPNSGITPVLGTTTPAGATVTFAASGTFTYIPPPGYEGAASFTYTLTNASGTSAPATVSLNVTGMIWFVDENATVAGDGRLATPFDTVAAFQALNNGAGNNPAANDSVFLYQSATVYTGPVTLLNGQRLIGQDASATLASISGVTVPADSIPLPAMNLAAPATTIGAAAGGDAVRITNAASNTIRGLTIGNVGAAGTGINMNAGATTFGTLTIGNATTPDVIVNTDGRSLNLQGGTLNANLVSTTSTGGAGVQNLRLATVAGTQDLGTGALSGSTVAAVSISGTNTLSYSGTITNTAAADNMIDIQNHSAGTITLSGALTKTSGGANLMLLATANGTYVFSGALNSTRGIAVSGSSGTFTWSNASKVLNTGAANAVALSNNTGAVLSFTNGGLDIDTTSGTGFSVTGAGPGAASGGNVTVQGSGNVIDAVSATALNVVNATIGGANMTFERISAGNATAAADPASGIVLNNTGSAGGLVVTGNSSGACGGSVTVNSPGTPATTGAPNPADCTGGLVQSTTAAGIVLTATANVSLTRVRVLDPGTDGIQVNAISGFTLARSLITDSAGVAQDRGIELGDFSTGTAVNGTINVTNSTLGPTPHDNFGVGIGSGTSTWNITNTVFAGSSLNSGFNFEIRNATVSALTIDGSVFQNQFADGLQMQPASGVNATVSNATIQNSTFLTNNIGMDLNHDGTGNVTYRVLNNTFRGHRAQPINFFSSAVQAPATGGTLNGRFENNFIGTSAIAGSGSEIGNGIRVNINGGVDATVLLNNNTIRQTPGGRGIEVIGRNGTGGLDVTITNNNVDHINPGYCAPGETPPCAAAFPLAAIFVQSNCVGVCNTVRSDVRGNTVPAGTADGELLPTYIALLETSGSPTPPGSSTLNLVDSTAPPSGTCSSELAGTNTGSASANAGCSLIVGPISTPP
jgi:hypothetical protein